LIAFTTGRAARGLPCGRRLELLPSGAG